MSLTKPIPQWMKDEMNHDAFMKKCCLCGYIQGKIDFHHNFIYAGSRVNEIWAILPLCRNCHRLADITENKEKLDWIMMSRMDPDDMLKYNRYSWGVRYRYLSSKFTVI